MVVWIGWCWWVENVVLGWIRCFWLRCFCLLCCCGIWVVLWGWIVVLILCWGCLWWICSWWWMLGWCCVLLVLCLWWLVLWWWVRIYCGGLFWCWFGVIGVLRGCMFDCWDSLREFLMVLRGWLWWWVGWLLLLIVLGWCWV